MKSSRLSVRHRAQPPSRRFFLNAAAAAAGAAGAATLCDTHRTNFPDTTNAYARARSRGRVRLFGCDQTEEEEMW